MKAKQKTSTANILLVEDERIVALDIASTLAELGYLVVASVSSGEAAVEKAAQLRPNRVLMDIRLAGKMDGIQAARQIGKQVDIPVIFLTAHSDTPTLDRAKNTEPLGYMVKPFKLPELRCAIEIALHRREVEDNGVGLPAEFDIRRRESLGMHLVCTLAEQLGAELEMAGGKGTSVKFTFSASGSY